MVAGVLSPVWSALVIIIVLAVQLFMYWVLYRHLENQAAKLRGLSEEERRKKLGIVFKDGYYVAEKMSWYQNPRFWEIATLIVSVILLILFW